MGGEAVSPAKSRSWERVGLILFVLTICHDIPVARGRVDETGRPLRATGNHQFTGQSIRKELKNEGTL